MLDPCQGRHKNSEFYEWLEKFSFDHWCVSPLLWIKRRSLLRAFLINPIEEEDMSEFRVEPGIIMLRSGSRLGGTKILGRNWFHNDGAIDT